MEVSSAVVMSGSAGSMVSHFPICVGSVAGLCTLTSGSKAEIKLVKICDLLAVAPEIDFCISVPFALKSAALSFIGSCILAVLTSSLFFLSVIRVRRRGFW
jgi:hypothetical protein